jgi:hypothetical protein
MLFDFHNLNNKLIAELTSRDTTIHHVDDALDLLGNASYQGASAIIIREGNLCPDFFNLSTCIAGEILQKFSTYRMNLAIIGDFSKYSSKSLRDFMYESNKGGHIIFAASTEEAIARLTE